MTINTCPHCGGDIEFSLARHMSKQCPEARDSSQSQLTDDHGGIDDA